MPTADVKVWLSFFTGKKPFVYSGALSTPAWYRKTIFMLGRILLINGYKFKALAALSTNEKFCKPPREVVYLQI